MIFGFSLVLILVACLAVYNFIILNNSNKTVENVLDEELPALIADEKLVIGIFDRIASARGYVLSGDRFYKDLFDEVTVESEIHQETIKKIAPSEKFDTIVQETIEWRERINEEVFNEYDNGNEDVARANLLIIGEDVHSLVMDYEELALGRENDIIEMEESVLAEGNSTILIVGVVSVFVILLGIAIAMITSISISRPLGMVKIEWD